MSSAAHHAGIDMRQQPGFARTRLAPLRARYDSVVAWPSAVKLVARLRVAQLRLVAEREQRLLAAGAAPATAIVEHLVDARDTARSPAPRRMGERAIMADVAAKLRQRNEDLARIGDEVAMRRVATRAAAAA